jgi:hypothetical protein
MCGRCCAPREHILEIGRTVLVGRRADADELQRAVMHRGGDVGRELQRPAAALRLHHLLQTRLMDRDAAAVEDLDLAFVDIQAQHVVAHFRQAGAGDQADVAGANDGDFHMRTTFLSDLVITAIPIDEARDAFRQRRAGAKSIHFSQRGGVGVGRRHVARLHRQHPLLGQRAQAAARCSR